MSNVGGNKGESLKDILQVTAMFVLLIAPFLLAGLWWWVAFWVVNLSLFALFEVVSKLKTGKTLTKYFKEWARRNPPLGYLAMGSMLLGWLFLLWHLWFEK